MQMGLSLVSVVSNSICEVPDAVSIIVGFVSGASVRERVSNCYFTHQGILNQK